MEAKNLKSINIEDIEMEKKREEKLKKLNEIAKTMIKTKEDEALLSEGYALGYARVGNISTEKLNNHFFRSGYERGLRTKAAEEYQAKINIVEEMVKNNIEFELAPEEIVNDSTLRTHYLLYKNRMKIDERRREK